MLKKKKLIPLALACLLLAGCGDSAAVQTTDSAADGSQVEEIQESDFQEVGIMVDESMYTAKTLMEEIELEDEAVALADSPIALVSMLLPEHSGTDVKKSDRAEIDYSNIKDGYVMVNFTDTTTTKRLKVRVVGPETTYDYNLTAGVWTTFPLSDGNGDYKVTVYENTTDTKYASVVSVSFTATLADEFAPFLRPNQYVDYENAVNTIAKAKELVGEETAPLQKVAKVYDYVITNLTYDKEKAATVQSGYLPVLDTVLAEQKGICFDYAALMTGMLRSQGVPCKLVVGYAGTAYHAWISVWSEETGWVEGAIYFDGSTWQRMDPTFASTSNSSDAVMKYIGDGSNYSAKYFY